MLFSLNCEVMSRGKGIQRKVGAYCRGLAEKVLREHVSNAHNQRKDTVENVLSTDKGPPVTNCGSCIYFSCHRVGYRTNHHPFAARKQADVGLTPLLLRFS